jgi:ribosome maturation protein Sdo1
MKRLNDVVFLKKHGMCFEILGYNNTMLSWNSETKNDLDNVLQYHTVYSWKNLR